MRLERLLAKQLTFLCVALFALATVTVTGLGGLYRSADPARALVYNPFDGEARAQFIKKATAPTADEADLRKSKDVAWNGIRYAPIDARMRSLLAEVHRQQGEEQEAALGYKTALALSRTDSIALQRRLQTALEQGDFESAVAKLDVLFRRWPSAFDSFAPAVPFVLRDPDGFQFAIDRLRQNPPWRALFLTILDRDPQTLDLSYRVLLALNQDGSRPDETVRAQNALLRNRDYVSAFRLFLLTQSDEDRQNFGYVFNGKFALESLNRPFDWYIANTPGVSIRREPHVGDGEQEYEVKIHFLSKPVRRIGFSQVLLIPPGNYRLVVEANATNIKAPKGLYFELECLDPRGDVTRLDIPTGSYRDDVLQGSFSVPDATCKAFQLALKTGLKVESFRYRYSGILTVTSVSISRDT